MGHDGSQGHDDCSGHDCSSHSHGPAAEENHGHGHGHGAEPDPVLTMLAAVQAPQNNEAEGDDDEGPAEDDEMVEVELSEADRNAVDRLAGLGFPREAALEAYLACDRKEELAANFLFDG